MRRLERGCRGPAGAMADAHAMSGRALVSTLAVARTIADIGECEAVTVEHLAEALGFRLREGVGGC